MINSTKTLCPDTLIPEVFRERILPGILDCECEPETVFEPEFIPMNDCLCPPGPPPAILFGPPRRIETPRDCFESYIKNIVKVKFCLSQGPVCE